MHGYLVIRSTTSQGAIDGLRFGGVLHPVSFCRTLRLGAVRCALQFRSILVRMFCHLVRLLGEHILLNFFKASSFSKLLAKCFACVPSYER